MTAQHIIPRIVHRLIAWARDGKWNECPCCHRGFGNHQVHIPAVRSVLLYNRISMLCPDCQALSGSNVVIITPPRPCACPDCGHIETSLSAMGRHWSKEHGTRENLPAGYQVGLQR